MDEDLGVVIGAPHVSSSVVESSSVSKRKRESESDLRGQDHEFLSKKPKLDDSHDHSNHHNQRRGFVNVSKSIIQEDCASFPPSIRIVNDDDADSDHRHDSRSASSTPSTTSSSLRVPSNFDSLSNRRSESNKALDSHALVCLSAASTAPSLKGDEEDDDDHVASTRTAAVTSTSKSGQALDTVKDLPVWSRHHEIVESIKKNQVTMIVGETGSGKTTQIPQMLLSYFNSQKQREMKNQDGSVKPFRPPVIAITQPRRVAAISLATRVLEELRSERRREEVESNGSSGSTGLGSNDLKPNAADGSLKVTVGRQSINNSNRSVGWKQSSTHHSNRGVDPSETSDPLAELGGLVGFSVRFQSRASRQTQIKFLTDGMILREAMVDPLLRRYRVIIIDEAHERTLRTDILLGVLKTLLKTRPSLRIVVMSATLDYRAFTSFLGQGEVILVPGRQYPVVTYNTLKSHEEYMESLVDTITQLHLSKEGHGDILAFLPGQEEIELARSLLNEKAKQLHDMQSEFARWKGVVTALKCLSSSPSAWRAFLEGEWDQNLTKEESTSQSDRVEDTKQAVGDDQTSTSIQKYRDVPKELREVLTSFGVEEFQMARQLRRCFSGFKIDLGNVENLGSEAQELEGEVIPSASAQELEVLVLESVGSCLANSLHTVDGHSSGKRVLLSSVLEHSNRPSIIKGRLSSNVESLLDLHILPIYAALPVEQQQLVFQQTPPHCRKIILATNIAETSVTIPGVRYVVDCGLHKIKTYNPRSGVETLAVQTISRAMANQRSGRAGREGPGESYRLFTEQDYYRMDIQADPEIKRSNLAQVVLELKTLGVKDVALFPFISKPNMTSLEKALQLLTTIGALDRQGEMTEVGHRLAALPVDPEFGKFLLDSVEFGCTAEVLTIVAVLNSDPIFLNISRRSAGRTSQQQASGSKGGLSRQPSPEAMMELARKKMLCILGDHLSILNAYRMWEETAAKDRVAFCKTFGLNHRALLKAKNIRGQLKSVLLSKSVGLTSISSCLVGGLPSAMNHEGQSNSDHSKANQGLDAVRRCLVKSFPGKIARLESSDSKPTTADDKDYSTARYVIEATRTPVSLHPSCTLFGRPNKPQFVVFSELIETSKLYMRSATAVEVQWLSEFHPKLFIQQNQQQRNTPSHSPIHQSFNTKPHSINHSSHHHHNKSTAAMLAMRTGRPFSISHNNRRR